MSNFQDIEQVKALVAAKAHGDAHTPQRFWSFSLVPKSEGNTTIEHLLTRKNGFTEEQIIDEANNEPKLKDIRAVL